MNTHYINTDLDLVAPYDLSLLATVLEAKGVWPLHVTLRQDGSWSASFETVEHYATPEMAISEMLEVIEALQGEGHSLWSGCNLRGFNIGYECGEEPFSFTNELSQTVLLRMSKAGAGLRITLYGASHTSAAEQDRTTE